MPQYSKKIRIAVLFGGRSGEHEVSLVSATSVIKNLDKEKYEVIPIGITKQGKWIAGPESMKLLKSGQAPSESNALIPPEPTDLTTSTNDAVKGLGQIDVVFPVLHGPYGEDGTVQGFLELTGLAYIGCGTLASSVCMDKVIMKKVLQAEGLPQVEFVWFWSKEWVSGQEKIITNIENELKYPVFVKPPNMGSSVGISKAKDRGELIESIKEAIQYDRKIIIEQGVENVRELECSVLGNRNPKVSVVGEIIPSNEFYDYDAKYVDGKSEAKIPAELPKETAKKIQDLAIMAYKALNCEGMARADFLLAKDNKLYINELNTIPGFTSISMYPKLWEASGVSYQQILDELIQLAIERNKEKQELKIEYTPKEDWYN
jgi:D-alanine-D-alanine ligase